MCVYVYVHAHICVHVCVCVSVFSHSPTHLSWLWLFFYLQTLFRTVSIRLLQTTNCHHRLLIPFSTIQIFFTRFYCKLNFLYISHLRSSKWLKILRLQPFSPSKFCNMSPVLSKRQYFKEDISPTLPLSSFGGTCVCRLDDCKIFVLLFSPFILWEAFLIGYL